MLSDASTPLRCCGACLSIIAANSVPFTLRSISSSWHIHQASSSGDGLNVSKCAEKFSRAFDEKWIVVVAVGEQARR
jgi:hypothetical protein